MDRNDDMGLFNFKNIFKKDKKEVESYEKGLEKRKFKIILEDI